MIRLVALLFTFFLLITGCAPKKQETMRVFWPPLPSEPYFEWLGTYATQIDMPRDSTDVFLDDLLGTRHDFRFGKPSGIAGDSERNLVYVADGDRKHVYVFNFNTSTIASLTREPLGGYPAGLALDSQKNLYVCDALGGVVLKVSAAGVLELSFGREVLQKPVHIALHEGLGQIYVTDVKQGKVMVFNVAGEFLYAVGEGQLHGPQGVAVDNDGNIYVADQLNARIAVFNAKGEMVNDFGVRGDKDWNFEGPRGLAFDSDGNLWVTDVRKSAFLVFDKSGTLLLNFSAGRRVSHPLSLAFPSAVSIDSQDRVYFADLIYTRFQVWQYLSQAYKAINPLTEEMRQHQLQLMREAPTKLRK